MPRLKGWRERRQRINDDETPLGSVIEDLMRTNALSRGAPIGTMLSSWSDVVGQRLASESVPMSLDEGVLVIAVTSGPWGSQVRFLLEEIRRRTDAIVGAGTVKRVQVVVRPDVVQRHRAAPSTPTGGPAEGLTESPSGAPDRAPDHGPEQG